VTSKDISEAIVVVLVILVVGPLVMAAVKLLFPDDRDRDEDEW
jgi:hypothetical protein